MDTKQTRATFRFDPDRLRALPEETTEVYEKFLRDLGLKPGWVEPGADITVDTAEHHVATRYLVTPEGTDGRTARPDSIPDGNGLHVQTVPHVEKYDGKDLPEIPAELTFALADNEQRATGRLGEL